MSDKNMLAGLVADAIEEVSNDAGASKSNYVFERFLDSPNYQDIPLSIIPPTILNEVETMAAALLDKHRGKILVAGNTQTGKTTLINMLVSNVNTYGSRIGREPFVFLTVSRHEFPRGILTPDNLKQYVSDACDEYKCSEDRLCLYVTDPGIASVLFAAVPNVRIITEFSEAIYEKLMYHENRGTSKEWNSWDHRVLEDIWLTEYELKNFIYNLTAEDLKKQFNMTITKRMVGSLINAARNQVGALNPAGGARTTIPFGIWVSLFNQMISLGAITRDKDLYPRGTLVISRLASRICKDNESVLEHFISDSEPAPQEINVIGGMGIKISLDEILNMGEELKEESKQESTDTQCSVDFRNLFEVREDLVRDVIGQDDAINAIIDSLSVSAAGLNDPSKPMRTMLFAGPTGVGKTEATISLSNHLATTSMNLIRLDMSEYSSSHEVSKLFGAPPGYAGFDNGGILTNAVKKNPNSIILLDEIEKAHPKIWDSFLQVFDAGRMTDGAGDVVDFSNTIIIMTSNLGVSDMSRTPVGFMGGETDLYGSRQLDMKRAVSRALESEFRLELVNRIDEIIIFNEISSEAAKLIVRKEINELASKMKSRGSKLINIPDSVVEEIISKANVSKFGARDIKRVVHKEISVPVSKALIFADKSRGTISLECENGTIGIVDVEGNNSNER